MKKIIISLFFLIFFLIPVFSSIGTDYNDPTSNVVGDDCQNPANLFTSDDVRTNCNDGTFVSGITFGFNVPASAVSLDGIQVRIEKLVNSGTWDINAQLYNASGALVGDVKNTGNFTNMTDDVIILGGVADTWNASLNPADANNSLFGVKLTAIKTAGGGGSRLRIDNVDINVSYTVPINKIPDFNLTEPKQFDVFDNRLLSNIDVNFTIQDLDNNSFLVTLNYLRQGFGVTPFLIDENTDGANIICEDSDFTDITLCTYPSFSIDLLPDGNYLVDASVRDDEDTAFDAGEEWFEIITTQLNDFNIDYPQNQESFPSGTIIDLNFWLRDGSGNDFNVDLNYSVAGIQGTGVKILEDSLSTIREDSKVDFNFSFVPAFTTGSTTLVDIIGSEIKVKTINDSNIFVYLTTSSVKTGGVGSGDVNVAILVDGQIIQNVDMAETVVGSYKSIRTGGIAVGLTAGIHTIVGQMAVDSGQDFELTIISIQAIPMENNKGKNIPNNSVIGLSATTSFRAMQDIAGSDFDIILKQPSKIWAFLTLHAHASLPITDANFILSINDVNSPFTLRTIGTANAHSSVGIIQVSDELPAGTYNVHAGWITDKGTLTAEPINIYAFASEANTGFDSDFNYIEVVQDTSTNAVLEDIDGASVDVNLQTAGRIIGMLSTTSNASIANTDITLAVNINGVDGDLFTRSHPTQLYFGSFGAVYVSDVLSAGVYNVKGRVATRQGTATLNNIALASWTFDTNGFDSPECDDENFLDFTRCTFKFDTGLFGVPVGDWFAQGSLTNVFNDLNFDAGNDYFTLLAPVVLITAPSITTRYFMPGDDRNDFVRYFIPGVDENDFVRYLNPEDERNDFNRYFMPGDDRNDFNRYFTRKDFRIDANRYMTAEDVRFKEKTISDLERIANHEEKTRNNAIGIFILFFVFIVTVFLGYSGRK